MKRTIPFIIGAVFLLVASGVLVWLLIIERTKTKNLITLTEQLSGRSVDFVVYRAYKDAPSEIKSGTLYFASSDVWERSFQIGSLKVVVEPVPPFLHGLQQNQFTPAALKSSPQQSNSFDWHAVYTWYNWHKSRAAFRQLQERSTPSAASELLDGLERLRVLTHPERLGVESTNVLDPY